MTANRDDLPMSEPPENPTRRMEAEAMQDRVEQTESGNDRPDAGCALERPPAARPAVNPLGPVIEVRQLQRPLMGRLRAAGLALAMGGLLGTAAWLSPAPGHMGTHRQLGLLPCGFVTMTGYPCPTCGMTTAFAYTVHGHWLEAIRSQPAGFLIALTAGVIGLSAAGALATGRYPVINWYRVDPNRFVWLTALALVASWGLKIAMGLLDGTIPAK
jgi:hypothetical protein